MNTQQLQEEIKFLVHDTSYDIDNEHKQQRLRIIKEKRELLKQYE